MYLLKPIFWTYLFCYFTITSHAQSGIATLIAPTATTRTGDSITISLRLRAIDSLSSVQFSFAWDSTVLQFGRVSAEGLPPQMGFGLPQTPNAGRLTFLWFDPTTRGIRFIDTIQVFLIHFKVIGASGAQSPLKFEHYPTRILASDRRLNAMQVQTQQGNFTVWRPNATENKAATEGGKIEWQTLSPNPNLDLSPFTFQLFERQTLTLQIISSSGQIIFHKKQTFEAGKHQILPTTEGGKFSTESIYFYHIQSNDFLWTQKFLIIK